MRQTVRDFMFPAKKKKIPDVFFFNQFIPRKAMVPLRLKRLLVIKENEKR